MFMLQARQQTERELRQSLNELESAHRSLAESEDKYRDLFMSARDMLHIVDAKGRIIDVNQIELDTLGYCRDEMIGMPLRKIIHPDYCQRTVTTLAQLLEGKPINMYETALLSKYGDKIPVEVSVAARFNNGVFESARAIIRDLTARKKNEQRRLELQAKMEHMQRLDSLGVLAGGIAHDFNNILTAILGNAAMAERKAMHQPMDTQKHLSNIVASSERAAELCKQMLAYSGKGKFVVKAIDLSTMVAEVSKLLEVSITKNAVIKYHLAKNLPAVDADVAQLQQVIMNLVINASDAIDDASGVISIATGIIHADANYLADSCLDDALPEGRYVFLEVSDTGCGMDEQTQEKIFEPFFTTKFTGHGLGMSAVLGIVRGHHGAMKLYSELGRGTTFKVLLPVSNQCADVISEATIPDDSMHASGAILIVDDEEIIRETAAMMLEDMGFTTLQAVDGEDGVAMYRQHQQKIVGVLLDMTMPKMDGKACFTELRRINKDVKVVLSSGYNEQEATSRFAGQGLAGFIQKPYLPQTLEATMRELIEDDS